VGLSQRYAAGHNSGQIPAGSYMFLELVANSNKEFTGVSLRVADEGNTSNGASDTNSCDASCPFGWAGGIQE
jgi:hypothetical protein